MISEKAYKAAFEVVAYLEREKIRISEDVEIAREMASKYMDQRDRLREVVAATDALCAAFGRYQNDAASWLIVAESPVGDDHIRIDAATENLEEAIAAYRVARAKMGDK